MNKQVISAGCQELFKPLKIGNIEVDNRIVMLPVTTNYSRKGRITQHQQDFYIERARGGAGLICFGFLPPVSLSDAHATGTSIDTDDVIPVMRELTTAIHAAGSKVLAQICIRHEWRKSPTAPLERVGPSANVVTGPGFVPLRELSLAEIAQIVDQFAEAARRAREAGFDMVEFHCGLGYLINRFISSATNKRTDKYGGSLEDRMRFLLDILASSWKKAGSDYTIGCRISAEEYVPGGHTLAESRQVARILEKAGVHWLNVQAGWLECSVPLIQNSVPQGAYVYLADGIKKEVKIPVVAAHRINDPLLADRIIAEGKADLVGMCRALIADPYLPQKAKEGRLEDIRPCLGCCECLDSQYVRGEEMGCSVNPWIGKERQNTIVRVPRPKKVFVIGAGPAGMEAAIRASQRGHKVTLFEANQNLGGQLIPAGVPPYKDDLVAFARYLAVQVKKAGVDVKSGSRIEPETIIAARPDAVVVATGATPSMLDVQGIKGNNVVNPIDVLMGKVKVGRQALVVGGGLIGCETAEFLASKGKQVVITTRQDKVGNDIGASTRWVMRKRLQASGVKVRPGMTPIEITTNGVTFQHNGDNQFVEADTIIMASGMKSENSLVAAMQGKVKQGLAIGDCSAVRQIRHAVEEGARAGMDL